MKLRVMTVFYATIFISSILALGYYGYAYYSAEKTIKETRVLYQTPPSKLVNETQKKETGVRPQFANLLEENKDTVGWVSIDGTKIHNPIVQAATNDHYLNRDFYEQINHAGTVFMDYRNDLTNLGKNTILYGHAMRNGSMFGQLKSFLDQEYANEHPVIFFDTLYEGYDVEIFAAYETTIDFYYIETEFRDEVHFEEFIDAIDRQSQIDLAVDVAPTDQILTLSTCNNTVNSKDKRFVVHGKLVKRN